MIPSTFDLATDRADRIEAVLASHCAPYRVLIVSDTQWLLVWSAYEAAFQWGNEIEIALGVPVLVWGVTDDDGNMMTLIEVTR